MFDDISVPILSGMELILFGDNHRLFHSKVRYFLLLEFCGLNA